MKQAGVLTALIVAALELGRLLAGAEAVLVIVYGAIALMALMFAATFLWLWIERTTPLALGMAYSWAGAGLFVGWWWIGNLSGPAGWADNPRAGLLGQALCLVGAVLHFAVIHRSFGWHGIGFIVPVLGALAASTAVYFAV